MQRMEFLVFYELLVLQLFCYYYDYDLEKLSSIRGGTMEGVTHYVHYEKESSLTSECSRLTCIAGAYSKTYGSGVVCK